MISGPDQLVLEFEHRTALGREDFLVADCNEEAIALIDKWPNWSGPAVVLCGERGSGKTHLGAVWCKQSNAVKLDICKLNAAKELIENGFQHFLIEEADKIFDEKTFLFLYNQIVDLGGTLLLTAGKPPASWQFYTLDLASRLKIAPVINIGKPDDNFIAAVLVKMFMDRQLKIGPDVIRYLLPRMERSLWNANFLVNALDAAALSQQRMVTVPLVRNILNNEDYKD